MAGRFERFSYGFTGVEYAIDPLGRQRLRIEAGRILLKITDPAIQNNFDYIENPALRQIRGTIARSGCFECPFPQPNTPIIEFVPRNRVYRNDVMGTIPVERKRELARMGQIWMDNDPETGLRTYGILDDLDAAVDETGTKLMIGKGDDAVLKSFVTDLSQAIKHVVEKENPDYFRTHQEDILTGTELFILGITLKHIWLAQQGQSMYPQKTPAVLDDLQSPLPITPPVSPLTEEPPVRTTTATEKKKSSGQQRRSYRKTTIAAETVEVLPHPQPLLVPEERDSLTEKQIRYLQKGIVDALQGIPTDYSTNNWSNGSPVTAAQSYVRSVYMDKKTVGLSIVLLGEAVHDSSDTIRRPSIAGVWFSLPFSLSEWDPKQIGVINRIHFHNYKPLRASSADSVQLTAKIMELAGAKHAWNIFQEPVEDLLIWTNTTYYSLPMAMRFFGIDYFKKLQLLAVTLNKKFPDSPVLPILNNYLATAVQLPQGK